MPRLPAFTVQVPLAEAPSALEQTSQLPEQAELQHRPSAQNPEAHWVPAVQDPPSASTGTQALEEQKRALAQSAVDAHWVGQLAEAPHL